MTSRSALATQAPFHLEATVRVLQRRPANRVDLWEGGRYLRVLAWAAPPFWSRWKTAERSTILTFGSPSDPAIR